MNARQSFSNALVFLIAPAVFTCGADEAAAPESVHYRGRDLLGNEVVLTRPPRRIVSLAPSNTEIVFALGAGDRLVGVSAFSDYPPEAARLPRVGDLTRPDLERVAALSPDLVLAGNKADADTLGLFRSMRVPAAVTEGSNFEETYRSIFMIGAMTGEAAAAEALTARMKAEVDEVAAKAKNAPRPLCYYIVAFGDGGDWTAGPGSFIDEMIGLAGGRNAGAALGKPWGIFQLEALVALDPAVVIAGGHSGPLDRLPREPGYAALSAVREGRLAIVDDDLVGRPGPRLAQGLLEIARAVHPEIFGPPGRRNAP